MSLIRARYRAVNTIMNLPTNRFVGFLDLFPNAAFAPSIRLLRKNYSGGLVRVRAWDGLANQGEADVMAYRVSATEYLIDLNSTLENLDATAIGRGLTTSDTLADLVSTGVNDYDGLVSAWYDQSTNGNDATQSSATAQPKIVDAGALVTENGKPAIEWSGTESLVATFGGLSAQPTTMFMIVNKTDHVGYLFDTGSVSFLDRQAQGNATWIFAGSVLNNAYPNANLGSQVLFTSIFNGASSSAYINGVQTATGDAGTGGIVGITLGRFWNFSTSVSSMTGTFQEPIIYTSNQSFNKASIESNQATFYGITL